MAGPALSSGRHGVSLGHDPSGRHCTTIHFEPRYLSASVEALMPAWLASVHRYRAQPGLFGIVVRLVVEPLLDQQDGVGSGESAPGSAPIKING